MDGSRFDRLAKAAAHSLPRRDAVRILVGGALAAGGAGLLEANAKKKPKTCEPGADVCSGTGYRCGSKKKRCFCATGTEGTTICGSLKKAWCMHDSDLCQVDADCDEQTGPGSVCTGGSYCTCRGVSGYKGCVPPCSAKPVTATSGRGATSTMRLRPR